MPTRRLRALAALLLPSLALVPSAARRPRRALDASPTIGAVGKKIASLHPRLGEHLRASVRMGSFCVYAPDPTSPIRWEL